MRTALHAEWTKLRTVASPPWLAGATVALTVALGAIVAGAQHCPVQDCSADGASLYDTTKLALSGVQVGQAVVAALAVLAVGGEYSTGMIRTTLAAMPRRGHVLIAKSAVIAAAVLVTATLTVAGSLLTGRAILAGRGFTTAHGYPPLSLGDATTLRAAGGTVLYLTLVALLSVGLAVAMRDSAVAIGAALSLLYLFPILSGVITNPHWQRRLHQFSPSEAGLAIQTTIDVRMLPIGPWAGLGVLALWAAGALILGAIVLRYRDA
jgi:ABC-2 type transport system permease protein